MDALELIRAVAQEVLKQIRREAEKACVMVLEARDVDLLAKVQECVEKDTEVLFFGEDAGNRTPLHYILPSLSCGAMAELAGGKASGPLMSEALRLLLTGSEVEILEFEYRAYNDTAPWPLYSLYESYEKTLATYGMREFRRTKPGTVRLWENLVTERSVIQAQENGASVLWVPVTAKVTPLAAEAAKTMNIAILKR